jgi:hypothetical protein
MHKCLIKKQAIMVDYTMTVLVLFIFVEPLIKLHCDTILELLIIFKGEKNMAILVSLVLQTTGILSV